MIRGFDAVDGPADQIDQGIGTIDLLAVNLYPFQQTVAKPDCTLADAIEKTKGDQAEDGMQQEDDGDEQRRPWRIEKRQERRPADEIAHQDQVLEGRPYIGPAGARGSGACRRFRAELIGLGSPSSGDRYFTAATPGAA